METSAAVLDAPVRRRATVVGAAVAAGVGLLAQQAAPAQAAEPNADLLLLLRRATFGPTPASLAECKRLGISGWLDQQLAPSGIDDSESEDFLKRFPDLGLRTWECREKFPSSTSDIMIQTLYSHLSRAIWSKRQLLEVMANFWCNHLVVPLPIGEVWDNAHLWHRDVLRKYAFGKYTELLAAAARHPALLRVLDNADSRKQAPNENFGRELLELHTVGIGNFTEADVKASALVLTGLSIDAESGLYEYKPERHYRGAVKVLGWSSSNAVPEDGEKVALSYLYYLARHPKTAERIVRKLCVRFVSDNPPSSLITKLVAIYRNGDTAIGPVLKALFTSDEFAASAGQKYKTPFEDVVATLRIFEATPSFSGTGALGDTISLCRTMGQVPMGWPAPNGYPDVAAAWNGTGSLVTRWNFHISIAGGWGLKSLPRLTAEQLRPATMPATYDDLVDALSDRLLVPRLSTAQRTALCKFVDRKPSDALKSSDAAWGWRLPYLMGLVLNSLGFAQR